MTLDERDRINIYLNEIKDRSTKIMSKNVIGYNPQEDTKELSDVVRSLEAFVNKKRTKVRAYLHTFGG